MPRPNGIYIFGSYYLLDATFLIGSAAVSPCEARKLHEFFDKGLKEYQATFNTHEMKEQSHGFGVYIRKAFDQSKKDNPRAVINYFTDQRDAR